MTYWLREIDGVENADLQHRMNGLEPAVFPPLQSRHLGRGFWWIAEIGDGTVVGFAGMVPMTPFDGVGYCKRAYVLPRWRGRGLQRHFLRVRIEKARSLGWSKLVSECGGDNAPSAKNFLREGFRVAELEQPWGAPDSLYFEMRL